MKIPEIEPCYLNLFKIASNKVNSAKFTSMVINQFQLIYLTHFIELASFSAVDF